MLNKTMDRADLESARAREVCADLDALVRTVAGAGLRMSSWYGGLDLSPLLARWEAANRGLDYEPLPGAADDERFPWFLYWEIAWLATNNDFRAGERLLDLGGSSSLFSSYMASRGLEVVTVDLNEALVANGDALAAGMGWPLRNVTMDMRALDASELGSFDHVVSVCVFEHIPLAGRIEVGERIRDLLVDGGSFSITFDYLNPARQARIGSPAAVREQFVEPSGLRLRGNHDFHDSGLRYLLHPLHDPRAAEEGWRKLQAGPGGEYTFGALFQERPVSD